MQSCSGWPEVQRSNRPDGTLVQDGVFTEQDSRRNLRGQRSIELVRLTSVGFIFIRAIYFSLLSRIIIFVYTHYY